MSRKLVIHMMKDLKAKASEMASTDYEDASIFCKFEDEYFTEEIANEFLDLINSIQSVNNSFSIDLRDNAFTDKHIKRLATSIAKHKNIKELVLWLPDNRITDEGAIELINLLDNFKTLKIFTINLEWNFGISNKTLECLCKKMPNMSQLIAIKVLISKWVK